MRITIRPDSNASTVLLRAKPRSERSTEPTILTPPPTWASSSARRTSCWRRFKKVMLDEQVGRFQDRNFKRWYPAQGSQTRAA